jgi:DNA-binding CsgD family transcriptional regulator
MNGEQLVMLNRFAGRLDDADLLLEELRDLLMRRHRWRVERVENLLARGEHEAAMTLELETMAFLDETVGIPDADHMLRRVRLLCGLDRVDEALGQVDTYLDRISDTESPITRSLASAAVWIALAAAHASGTEVPAGLPERARELLDLALDTTSEFRGTFYGAEALYAAATARRLAGEESLDHWQTAEAAATRFGDYFVLHSRIGLADALLTAGRRDEGRALLVGVWDTARAMGARGRAAEAAAVARSQRVQLAQGDATPRRLAALTAREREVLDALATGATNRAIAERLFISEKTVSVHVSNLMAKLRVSNRGEAAALARDLKTADQN